MKKTLLIISIAVLSACSVKLVTPLQTDAERGASTFPGLALDDLTSGKATFEQNCDACHKFVKPTKKTEAEWRKLVPIMVGKVNKKAGKEKIDAQSQENLLKYVVTMSAHKKR